MPSKETKTSKLWLAFLWVSISIPPILLTLSIYLAKDQSLAGAWLSKSIFYLSFVTIVFGLILSVYMLVSKHCRWGVATVGVLTFSLYTLLPIGMFAKAVSRATVATIATEATRETYTKRALSSTLLGTNFYEMHEADRKKFYEALERLVIGDHYSVAIRKMPPAPENSPINMKTHKSKIIVLRYYLEKKSPSPEPHPKDKHITLIFDSNQELIEIAKAI
jgi:hypothetical protein